MVNRGRVRDLWVGVLVAVPSGAGVALSVLGGNSGSLVGVAISASLLPPAVNAGLFWAMSTVLAASGQSQTIDTAFHGFDVFDKDHNATFHRYEVLYNLLYNLYNLLYNLYILPQVRGTVQ